MRNAEPRMSAVEPAPEHFPSSVRHVHPCQMNFPGSHTTRFFEEKSIYMNIYLWLKSVGPVS